MVESVATTLVRAVTDVGVGYHIYRTVELIGSEWKVGDNIALIEGKWVAGTGKEPVRAKITEVVHDRD